MTSLDPLLARTWLSRWDAQQERYVAEREARFTAIIDALAHAMTGTAEPLVVDLGCGPGSLSTRIAERLPAAQVIGVDLDPLLLGLARSAHPGTIRFVEADLRIPGWSRSLGLERPVDAVVSSTALHYLPADQLGRVYAEMAEMTRPGGVFVNADNLFDPQPGIADLAAALRRDRVNGGEDWDAWWRAVRSEPELAALAASRQHDHGGDHHLSVAEHISALQVAGFAQIGTVWQVGDDVILVALR